ncbi:mediator of RNA polymerase II transcription subunit 26-like isoform X2 [Cololabis saira]|uniref:mediator of RNA polymerase II transcription subunit 26-like isoform X2 n=1 Tax=Cololabis saira TaxID=129043 RepID=UPI002AD4AC3F|nr:mediator of RNA polymerase II transcription subunit 26-like isoform X2 [Cololabis saira]
MTALTATPHMMRDRLLQAIDGQSNIRNMVVVMEVISYLETYPITKETLEETRLGKLINDVRKKTKNEDLAKRAKKLLRNWQKLIEPVKGDLLSKGLTCSSWSSKVSANSCTPAVTPLSGKTGPELKSKNDFNNCFPKVEKTKRKCTDDQKEGQFPPAKIPKTTLNDKIQNLNQLPANGLSGNVEKLTNICAHPPLDRDISETLDSKKLNKIPVHAVKPHPSAPGCSKLPSTSSLIKASVRQQQVRQDQAASRMEYHPRNHPCPSRSPHTPKQEAAVEYPAAQTRNIHSVGVKAGIVDAPELGVSAQPFSECVQGIQTADLDSQSKFSSTSSHNSTASSCREVFTLEGQNSATNTERTKRRKYKPKDSVLNLDGHSVEDCTKPVRLKDRRLTFDPVTGQIKSSGHKDSFQECELAPGHRPELLNHKQSIPPSPFHQTDWKELSRSEIIQSYLNQQSNVLTSSGTHAPGAHFFMSEFLKKEEYQIKDTKKTHVLASEVPPKELPGISREVSNEDLNRLHSERWSGVNGCYDTKGIWYDWTECISLDPHGDESKLNILPYVCLD